MSTRRPPPPPWSTRTVAEDGGLTHETVSTLEPAGLTHPVDSRRPLLRTQVSVSVVDTPEDGHWTRSAPTVQVEGGSFPLAEALRLRNAIDELITLCTHDERAPSPGTKCLRPSAAAADRVNDRERGKILDLPN